MAKQSTRHSATRADQAADTLAPLQRPYGPAGEGKTVGSRLSRRRAELRLSQQQVADKIGISRPAYAQWELDTTKPDLDRLTHVARVLDTTPEFLAFGVQASSAPITGDQIQIPEIEFQAPTEERIVTHWGLPASYVKALGALPANLRIVRVPHNHVDHLIKRGDRMLVDITQTAVTQPSYYVHWIQGRADVSTVMAVHGPGSELLITNARGGYRVKNDEFNCLGRVIAAMTQV